MAQIFRPISNPLAKASLLGLILLIAALAWVVDAMQRTSYITTAGVPDPQPVPFSHAHHVGGLGIDCRYCHVTVESSPRASLPPTKTCMSCHEQIWTNAPMLEPVRESWRANRPIRWWRVNRLPDYVYFNHAAHIQKGVGCSTCHGMADRMPLMMAVGSLEMEWCLTCHREPERFLRPREQVFNLHYQPPRDQIALGRELAQRYHLLPRLLMENCSLCHR